VGKSFPGTRTPEPPPPQPTSVKKILKIRIISIINVPKFVSIRIHTLKPKNKKVTPSPFPLLRPEVSNQC
jgi:hypothetical protein